MFNYFKAAKAFKKDCDNFSTPYDMRGEGKNNVTTAEFSNRHHARRAVRFAACTAVAAAVVLTGTLTLPSLLQPKDTNSFEIVAKAADAPNGKVLTPNQKVKLNANIANTDNSNVSNTLSTTLASIDDCFKVEGKDIKTITYSTGGYQLLNYSDNYEKQTGAIKPVCTINIPKSEFKSSDIIAEFKQMWANGKFDEYKNKYFDGKDIDQTVYSIGFRYDENDITARILKLADIPSIKNTDVLISNTFTVSSDQQKNIAVQLTDTNGKIISDTFIAVTVTFNDGHTQTKTVGIGFDSIGLPYLTLNS